DLGAFGGAHARPGAFIESLAGGFDGALRVVASGACDACPRLLGGRVDRLHRLARRGVTEFSVDVKLVLLHGVPPCGGWCLVRTPGDGGSQSGARGIRCTRRACRQEKSPVLFSKHLRLTKLVTSGHNPWMKTVN